MNITLELPCEIVWSRVEPLVQARIRYDADDYPAYGGEVIGLEVWHGGFDITDRLDDDTLDYIMDGVREHEDTDPGESWDTIDVE